MSYRLFLTMVVVTLLAGCSSTVGAAPQTKPSAGPSKNLVAWSGADNFSEDIFAAPGALPPAAANALLECLELEPITTSFAPTDDTSHSSSDGAVSIYTGTFPEETWSGSTQTLESLKQLQPCLQYRMLPALDTSFSGLTRAVDATVTSLNFSNSAIKDMEGSRIKLQLDDAAGTHYVYLDVIVLSRSDAVGLLTVASSDTPYPLTSLENVAHSYSDYFARFDRTSL